MTTEKFTVDGSQVVEKIKELIHQGNIRRVRLIHKDRALIDIPLTAGVGVAAESAADHNKPHPILAEASCLKRTSLRRSEVFPIQENSK